LRRLIAAEMHFRGEKRIGMKEEEEDASLWIKNIHRGYD